MKDELPAVVPGEEWTVDRFRPEDAKGVVALFQSVYGEGYPVRTYVEPDLLIEENRAGRVISSVARTASGAIVGHTSLFNSAPNPRIFEAGAGLVHQHYRGGKGIFGTLTAHSVDAGRANPDVDLVYMEPVCNHPFSQKMCEGLGAVNRAMEVSLMPAAAYAKEKSAAGRVSTLLGFITLRPKPHTVYVPPAYETQFQFCYEGFDDQRTFVTDSGKPDAEKSRISVQIFDFASVARVAVSQIGKEFPARMAEEEKTLLDKGIRVLQVWLNTGTPGVGVAAAALGQAGYFFGGVLPQWFDTDGMLMQKVLDPPDWEGTVIVSEQDRKLAALVRAEQARAAGGA